MLDPAVQKEIDRLSRTISKLKPTVKSLGTNLMAIMVGEKEIVRYSKQSQKTSSRSTRR